MDVDKRSVALAEKDVREAGERIAKSRKAEVAATEGVELAEKKLTATRKQARADQAAAVTAAEQKVQAEQRKSSESGDSLRLAEAKLAEARAKHSADSSRVIAAENAVNRARSNQEDAVARVRAAEQSLSDTRSRSVSDASKVRAAEQQLAAARTAMQSAARSVISSAEDESAAKARLVAANEKLEASQRRLAAAQTGLSGTFNRIRSGFASLDSGRITQIDRSLTRAVRSATKLGIVSTAAASALVGVGGATGPALALGSALAAAAGSAALIPAALVGAGASFGALKLGVGGISDAFSASGKAAEAAGAAGAKAAADGIAKARQQRDAQQAITDAVRNQVRVRADGARRIDDAVRRAAEAESAYKDAVKEATLALRDLNAEVKSSSLSVEEAEIGLERAKERLAELKRVGTDNPLDLREAEVGVKRANLSLEEARTRYRDVSREAVEANAVGVQGAKNVVAAQRGVEDANRAVADAQRDSAEANADAARQVTDAVEKLRDSYRETGTSAQSAGDKAAEALAALAPDAQGFVKSVLGMRDAWDDMKRSVQGRLFAGTGDEVRLLGEKYIPLLDRRLGDVAGSFNTAAIEVSQYLRSTRGLRSVDTALANTSKTTDQLARAAAPLTEVFVRFGEIGSEYLTPLASKFADAAERARDFVDSTEGAKKIRGWIENGLTALSQLWSLLKNVGGIIGTVWSTANAVGGTLLSTLVDLTGQADEWLKSVEGQEVLTTIFETLRDVVNELKPGVAAVLGALKDAFVTLAPSLPGLAEAFSNIATALSPLVGWIADALKWLIDNALVPFGRWAKDNPGSVQVMAGAIIGLVGAIKLLNIGRDLANWSKSIGDAFGIIRSDADKASTAVGTEKSGLRGRLGALKKVGKIAITIVALYEGFEFISGLMDGGAGKNRLDTNKDNRVDNNERRQSVENGDVSGIGSTIADDTKKSWNAGAGAWAKGNYYQAITSWLINPDIAQKSALGWEAFGTTLRLKWEKMKSDAIGSAAGAYAGVSGWWNRTKTDVSNRASELATNAGNRLRELRDGASARASELWQSVSGWWARTKTDVGNRASELATNAGNRLRELRDNASAKASEIWSSVSGWFTRTRDDAQDRVRTLVDNVGKKWDELKGFFARPIKWVIDYVWNGTIANLWGRARELIPALPEFKRLATGGAVSGPGTATSDSIPAMLSDGEFVLSAADVNRLGGFAGVEKMRRNAREGLPAFASGGPVSWQDLQRVILGQFPTARITDTTRPGARDLHGAGKAIDIAGPRSMDMPFMLNVNRWIASNYGNSAELIHTPGVNLKNGQPHRYNDAVRSSHYNHVHWANNGGGILDALKRFGGGVWDTVSTYFRDAMSGIFDAPANAIRAMLGNLFPGDTLANRLPKDGANSVLDGVKNMLFGAADEQDAAGGGGGIAAGGTGPVADQVRAVARRFGWGDGAQWNAIVKLLGGESSWNPTIKNPTSSAYGLFQFLDSTWATVGGRKTSNPGEQAEYGFRYIRQRYGDPMGAYRTWLSRSPHWYDNGGILKPGRTSVINATGKPEAVLTAPQWATAGAAIRQVQAARDLASVSGSVRTKNINFNNENHFDSAIDIDAAMSRVSFLSGDL